MKRFGPLILVLGIAVVVTALATATGAQGLVQTSSAVQIPQELALAFGGLIFALVTAGLLWVFQKTGLDLTGVAQGIAMALSAFFLALAQHWIDLAPASADPWITMFLNILLVVLTGLGTLFLLSGGHKNLM